MKIPTYDETLDTYWNEFSRLIEPKKIIRDDATYAFKHAKATAKTIERVNSVLDEIQTPFSPLTCTEEQLQSLEYITQIKRLEGKFSGLIVNVSNTSESVETAIIKLYNGVYIYNFNGNLFRYTLSNPQGYIEVEIGSPVSLQFFMSDDFGQILVEDQDSITITREDEAEIDENLEFSCLNNESLLGRTEETDSEYRQRLVEFQKHNDFLTEIKNEIDSLPYVISSSVRLNKQLNNDGQGISVQDGNYTIEPFHLLVCVSGDIRKEIADIILKKTIFLTSGSDDQQKTSEFIYNRPELTNGEFKVYVNRFDNFDFKLKIIYKATSNLIDQMSLQSKIENTLKIKSNRYVHRDTITENEFYLILNELDLPNINILNVDLLDTNNSEHPYLSVPTSQIPNLIGIIFVRES